MQNLDAGKQINRGQVQSVSQLPPADGWLRLRITQKATKDNKNPKAVGISRDVPLSAKGYAARSMINAEKAHQEANPGAEPLEFVLTATINIPGQNDEKEDLVFF